VNYKLWIGLIGSRFCPLIVTATSLEGSKKITSDPFIYGQSSTIPANFVKIGPVDVEIGLTEITKNILKIKKTSAKHKPSSSAFRAERVG